MIKKLKRLLSTAMAAVMTVSCFMVVNTESVMAAETEYFAVMFNKGQSGKTVYNPCYIDSENNVLESEGDNTCAFMTGFSNRTDVYGTQAGANATIVINNVPAYARIDLGINDVGGYFKVQSNNSNGKFAEYAASSYIEMDTDSVIATNTATTGNWKTNSAAYVKSIYYKGGSGTDTVTLTTQNNGTTYLPYIAVYSVDAFDIAASSETTVTGKITCSDNTIDLPNVSFKLNDETITVDDEGNFSKNVTTSSSYVLKSDYFVNSKYYLYATSTTGDFGTLEYKSVGNKWDFSASYNQNGGYKYEGNAGYYLGLYVDASASGAKFATNNSGWFQTKNNTKIYIPVNSNLDKVNVVTYSSNVCTLAYEDGTYGKCQKLTMTGNDYIKSIEVVPATPVTLSGTYSGAVSNIYFTDADNNSVEATLDTSAHTYSVTLASGVEYTVSSNDNTLAATPSTVNITADTSNQAIAFAAASYVTVSGNITAYNGAENFVSSITFTDINDSSVSFSSDVTGNTYSVSVLPNRNYQTSAVTTGSYRTSNRVAVGSDNVTSEEVYFVADDFSTQTYDAATLENLVVLSSDPYIVLNGFSQHGGGHGPSSNNGYVSVTLPQAATVSAMVSYKGNITISGSTGTTVTAATVTDGTTATAVYTATGADNVTITINSQSYLKEIVITPINQIPYDDSISVPDDYPTLTSAITAVKNMSRTSGQVVTINVTSDLQEQVNVTANDIIINGNNHELSWYYALGGKYYSVDTNGYYNEELFRDKYSKNSANVGFWGGVMIVRGNNVRVEDLTIKNTFNYTVTDKELEDGVEWDSTNTGTGSAYSTHKESEKWTRTSGTNVKTTANRERANALAVFGDKAEFYNCSILSSQDTLGTNSCEASSHSYFKDCTIGGNVDYICGGGTMVFDDCILQWFDDGTGSGYITAPRTASAPYYFFNCKVTAESSITSFAGYFGRPWELPATAYFINTDITSGYINAAGWVDWSGAGGNAVDNAFYEYGNYNDKSLFRSTNNTDGHFLSNTAYNELVGTVPAILGFTPEYYNKVVVSNVKIADDVVVDNQNYVLVYGEVSESDLLNADEAGFVLSTNNACVNGTNCLSDEVYKTVKYTNSQAKTVTLTADDGKYYSIAVVEKATSGKNIYAIAADSNSFGEVVTAVTIS